MLKIIARGLVVLASMAMAAHAAAGEGRLAQMDDQAAWEGLRGRLSLGTSAPAHVELGAGDSELKVNSLSLMGDYYLGRSLAGTAGGWRATSGLLFGSRSLVWSSPSLLDRRTMPASSLDGSSDSAATLPYLGVGYTGWSSKGSWGLSADLGVMAFNPRSATRLGKVVNGTQSLDDTVRELRFSPLLQLGLSYSF